MKSFEKLQLVKGDNCTTGCLLNHNYFKKHKMIAIDLSKQQSIQNYFTGKLDGNNNRLMFFIIEELKETILNFSQGTVKVLSMCSTILFCSNIKRLNIIL